MKMNTPIQKITLEKVFFGDVWVCSGGSNMAQELNNVNLFLIEQNSNLNLCFEEFGSRENHHGDSRLAQLQSENAADRTRIRRRGKRRCPSVQRVGARRTRRYAN